MGAIVTNGKRSEIRGGGLEHAQRADGYVSRRKNYSPIYEKAAGKVKFVNISICSPASIQEVECSLSTIKSHFGISKAESLRLALRFLAQAVTEGRMTP